MTSASQFRLDGKSILVTGASSGIGRAAAQTFADLGARVVIWARRAPELDDVLRSLAGEGHAAMAVDVGQLSALDDAVKDAVARVGKLSGLFHAAGVEYLRPLSLIKEGSFAEAARVAFEAPVMLAKAFTKGSVRAETGASLVLMSSVAGLKGQAAMSLYSAARSAVDGAVRSMAVELAGKGIRVNSLVAGAVETAMHERITKNIDAKAVEQYKARHLLGFGKPEDVANAAAFLLSDAGRWITGTSLVCDGGYTCW